MLNMDNKSLCEFCFAEFPVQVKQCPHCNGEPNIIKYPTALPEGTILVGRYSVGKVLGKGGFGITYLCYDLKERKKVAIKEYLPDTLAHRNSGETIVTTYEGETAEHFKNGAEKFYEEAKLVSRFNGNPNIISVYEFFYENNTTYFVMEYLSGTDMKRYWLKNNKRLPEGEVLYIAKRAVEALMIVHSTDVLHRDISPDNIFLCDNGDIKLIDFGAARQVVADVSKSLSVILKHGFAPLEQYQRKGKQGPWTDIYALGASLYLALTGNLPDDAMSRLEEPALDLAGIDPAFAAVIDKMMAVKASDRYQNMFAVKNDLDAIGITAVAPQIGSKVQKNFCTQCGTKFAPGQTVCTQCQNPVAAQHNTGHIPVNTLPQSGVNYTQNIHSTGTVPKKTSKFIKIGAACAAGVILFTSVALIAGNKNNTDIDYYETDSSSRIPYDPNQKNNTIEGELPDNFEGGERTHTYDNGDVYVGEWKNGQPNGYGKYTWANGDIYEGDWTDGLRNGQGTKTFADGKEYTGEWKDDKIHGYGKFTWTDGNVYEGNYENDSRNGQGTFYWAAGDVYSGEWKEDKIEGYGKYTWANGDVYEGNWVNGQQNGQGTRKYADGDVYIGEWKDGTKNGQGTLSFDSGDVYTGEFSDGEINGYGKYTWANGGVYEGYWINSQRNGQGTEYYSSGNTYTGEFKNDKRNGQGTYTYTSGDVYTGQFEDGDFNGYGKYTWADGGVYEGYWANDQRNGQGTHRYAGGDVYSGEWKEDKRNGYGKYTWADGEIYEGNWLNGLRHGQGTDRYTSGNVYTGEFKDDKRNGQGTYKFANGDVYTGSFKDGDFSGYGKYTWPSGDVFEGNWENDVRNGYGTYTRSDGSGFSGTWKNGEYVQ